jgi:hypothetical protein
MLTMPTDGAILKAFIDQSRIRPVRIYTAMKISKQAFYKLYNSKEFELETIRKIEQAVGKPWDEIRLTNVDVNVSNETAKLPLEDLEKKQSLERSIENLTRTGEINAHNETIRAENEKMRIENDKITVESIRRLVDLLEEKYGKRVGPTLPPVGTPGTKNHNPRKQKKPAQ